jgi:chromosome segregation ATPase
MKIVRIHILFAVNEEIALTQAKTAEIRDELKSLQGNLAIQNNKVAEQELQLKWLKEKEKIMNSQKKHLEDTKMESQNTFVRYICSTGNGLYFGHAFHICNKILNLTGFVY